MCEKLNNKGKKLKPHPLHPDLLYNPELDKEFDRPRSAKSIRCRELLKKVGLPKEYYEENGPVVKWKE
ncbi:MAG: hypothetical protein J7497_07135 [Chitinophagaceae bacterium]|nr:hypothetical protein [Chitinophagaceae bacterium]